MKDGIVNSKGTAERNLTQVGWGLIARSSSKSSALTTISSGFRKLNAFGGLADTMFGILQ